MHTEHQLLLMLLSMGRRISNGGINKMNEVTDINLVAY